MCAYPELSNFNYFSFELKVFNFLEGQKWNWHLINLHDILVTR
jgi:hypothetical protein